jgi:chromosome segregation ATPase
MDLNEYQELKQQIEKSRRAVERATGGLAQLLKELKEKFGCNDIAQAKKIYKRMQKDLEMLEDEYKEKCRQLKKKHPQLFGAE